MAFFLMNAHNSKCPRLCVSLLRTALTLLCVYPVLSSCCGSAGNIFAKIFQEDGSDDVPAAAPFSSGIGGFTAKEAKYEDVQWSKLPAAARRAASALGYDESSWNGNEWRCDEHWWDLSAEQKSAVEALGWTEHAWEDQHEDCAWRDLPANVQRAARKLGYDASTWDETEEDDDKYPSTMEKYWSDFTKEEQMCMNILGYTQQMWED